jgi:hypothetical protein
VFLLQHCPRDECHNVVYWHSKVNVPVNCQCGFRWCYACQDETTGDHSPGNTLCLFFRLFSFRVVLSTTLVLLLLVSGSHLVLSFVTFCFCQRLVRRWTTGTRSFRRRARICCLFARTPECVPNADRPSKRTEDACTWQTKETVFGRIS